MRWLTVCCVLTAVYGGGGVTQTDPQLWADYKIFDHVYGKIFDKDLYGERLPPTIRFGDTSKYKTDTIFNDAKASEKKEVYAFPKNIEDYDKEFYEFPKTMENYDKELYAFPKTIDNYGQEENAFQKKIASYDILKEPSKINFLKEKPKFNFLSYNGFQPISESNDPETYNYFKRLEAMDREKKLTDKFNDKPEETYAYKVIQNILDAHEANKGTTEISHKEKKIKKDRNPISPSETPKRCQGRCRKRSGSNSRVRNYPVYKRIKYRFY